MRKNNFRTLDAYRIGYIIRRRRSERKMSQKELGERTGYCNTYLSQIENGYEMPSLAAFVEICKVLDLSMDVIFGLKAGSERDALRRAVLQTVTMMPDSQVHLVSDLLNGMHTLNRDMAAPMMLEDGGRG